MSALTRFWLVFQLNVSAAPAGGPAQIKSASARAIPQQERTRNRMTEYTNPAAERKFWNHFANWKRSLNGFVPAGQGSRCRRKNCWESTMGTVTIFWLLLVSTTTGAEMVA